MEDDETVFIPTLDPRGVGGVLSVTKFAYNSASTAGYTPHIVYNAIPWSDCFTIKDIIRWEINHRYERTKVEGLDGTVIGRIFPELESLNYLLTYFKWLDTVGDGVTFGVGGPCIPCLPFALANESYGCWIGTLIEDEREVQLEKFSTPRRHRYAVERPILKHFEKLILNRADRLLVQSTYTKRRINEEYGVSLSSIEHLPYPIDTDHFCPSPNRTDSGEIVFVGRFNDPRKNIELLLRAFRNVRESIPNATLNLIGDEPDNRIAGLITELGLRDAVNTPGFVPELMPYLHRADVFALPSRQEGLGIAALEAMSCGLPVVATKCGGPEDYVNDGETGYLVPIGDREALAERLITILADSTQRHRLGANARSLIEHQYEASKIESQLISIYDEL